jgi:hypothetical protein
MNTVADFPPSDFVDYLTGLQIPDYKGYPDGMVEVTQYQSGNPMFGGKAGSPASVLHNAVIQVAHAKKDTSLFSLPGFDVVFNGQGSMDNFIAAMAFINKYQDDFKKIPALKKYFTQADFLQAMANDACFGLDCIGFVGNYLVESGLENSFVKRRPLDYTAIFPPVKKLDDVKDLSVVMLTNGLHIQLLEKVTYRDPGYIQATLCQSTAGGIQVNYAVTIRPGPGNYLPVEAFRAAMNNPDVKKEYEADKAAGKTTADLETYLRRKMTQSGVQFGYLAGAIFNTTHTGYVPNPPGVSGSVYIGTPRTPVTVHDPEFWPFDSD